MKDSIQKSIEIWFRRNLIRFFSLFLHRNHALPENIDFNACKFLFIRQDRIGDVLVSTPLFAVLKKHYPGATIDVLLSTNNYFVLENDPLIRHRWIYRKRFGKIFAFIRTLRNEHYDFVVDLMDNPSATSTILCLFLRAKWNVGIAKNNSFAYDIIVPLLSRQETHIIDRIAQLLTPFQINPQSEEFKVRYCTSSGSDEYVESFLSERNLLTTPLIGVNISAGTDARFWGIENFASLLNHITEIYREYRVLVLYQPSDEARARSIAESNTKVILSPVTSTFDQFAAVVKRLSILITPDTSAVHLASAFGILAVVLYVQSDKKLRVWEPYGIDHEAIITDVDDLTTIPVTHVQEGLRKLLLRKKKGI
jgi:heptosyltransferase III